jgi:hypothetical protein
MNKSWINSFISELRENELSVRILSQTEIFFRSIVKMEITIKL